MRFLSVLAGLLMVSVPAHAQTVTRLTQALESVRWNSAERGPLLAVAPDSVQTTQPLPPGRQATSLPALAPLFSRRIVPVGTVTVLAPETMVVLNLHPELQTPPRMSRSEATRQLFGTFSEAQWRKVGSERGIGADDMETKEQRALFRIFTTTPLPIQQYQPKTKTMDRAVLSPDQLSGLRFRVRRRVFLQMVSTGKDGQEYAGPSLDRSLEEPLQNYPIMLDPGAAAQIANEESGKWTDRRERNRPKSGDLDFAAPALNNAVRLAGIKTVGEAVKRCAVATRLELYVDGRMGRLPLYVRADADAAALAGDVIKGLCWMLTGAVRKVQSGSEFAWVLTDDREGYATRMARIGRQRVQEGKANQASHRAEAVAMAALQERLQKVEAWRQLSDSGDLDFTPTDEIRRRLDTGPGGYDAPVSSLSEEILGRIEQASQRHRGLPLNRDKVAVRIFPQSEYMVPGMTPIRNYEERIMMLYFSPTKPCEFLPEPGPVPAPLPERLRDNLILLAAPFTPDAARNVLQTASAKGIRHVWLQADVETVRVGVGAGRELGIMVGAMVSLLRPEPKDMTPRDLDIFGKEGDWYLPDAPETFTKTQRRLRDYAAIPGLAGLILTDTAPPGCGIPNGDILGEDGSEMGYTPARRLAYLRSAGFDPVDLVRGLDPQPLPFMRDKLGWDEVSAAEDVEMWQANRGWGAVRYAANIALMGRLYADLRAAYPTLPLWVRNRGVLRHWYGSWDKPDSLPHFRASFPTIAGRTNFPTLFQTARPQSGRILFGISYRPGQYENDTRFAPLPDGPQTLARAINGEKSVLKEEWDGLVLDLRAVPTAKLPEFLEGVGNGQ